MIRRGESHVMYNKTEVMQRLKRASTIEVLEQLMYFYDSHLRRKEFESRKDEVGAASMPGFYSGEMWELNRLIELTKTWLQPPVLVNFKGVKSVQNKSRSGVNGKRRQLGKTSNLPEKTRRSRI